MNPKTNDEFGKVEIVNEHMHAQIFDHIVGPVVNFAFNLLY